MTSEPIIRLMTIDDAPRAAELWQLVFGDEESVVLEFFRLFARETGFGACAEADGRIVAAAYAPCGTDYVSPDGTVGKGVYLYAVATHPDYRKLGLAHRVCLLLRETAWAQGMDYLFTRPSEESLYDWYAEKLGAQPLLGCQTLRFARRQAAPLPCTPLTAEAYLQLRSQHLRGLPHVRQDIRWMHWEQTLHNAYGGGFYAVGGHIADLSRDGDCIHIHELLPHPTPSQAEALCQGLMGALDADRCECLIHGDGHYVSAAARNGLLPSDNGWFGPCYG